MHRAHTGDVRHERVAQHKEDRVTPQGQGAESGQASLDAQCTQEHEESEEPSQARTSVDQRRTPKEKPNSRLQSAPHSIWASG